MLRILPFLLMFGVGVYAFIDCLTTEEDKVRGLPKLAWVFILLLFWPLFLGPIGWFLAGRPRREASAGRGYGRSRTVHVAPDDNPEFLASLNRSNQEHEDMLKQWEDELRRADEDPRDEPPGDDLHSGDDGPDGDGRKKD